MRKIAEENKSQICSFQRTLVQSMLNQQRLMYEMIKVELVETDVLSNNATIQKTESEEQQQKKWKQERNIYFYVAVCCCDIVFDLKPPNESTEKILFQFFCFCSSLTLCCNSVLS